MKTLELVVENGVEVVRYFYQNGQTVRQCFSGEAPSLEEAIQNTIQHFKKKASESEWADELISYRLLIWDKKFGNPKVLADLVYNDCP